MRRICAGTLAAISLATAGGCSKPTEPKFYGLSSGQVSSFTQAPSGCAISLLFDDFRAPVVRRGKAVGSVSRSFTLASSPAAAGSEITFDIRGARINAATSTIDLEVAGQQLRLQPDADELSIRANARANQKDGHSLVEVTLNAPVADPPDPDALLTIDSIDIALPSCGPQPGRS